MPRYDFRCKCGYVTEVLASLSEGVPKSPPCELCAGATRRVWSPADLVFKGSGFHKTDYPKGSL